MHLTKSRNDSVLFNEAIQISYSIVPNWYFQVVLDLGALAMSQVDVGGPCRRQQFQKIGNGFVHEWLDGVFCKTVIDSGQCSPIICWMSPILELREVQQRLEMYVSTRCDQRLLLA